MTYFYDTCALLNLNKDLLKENYLMSSITLKELEEIKTSSKKDEEIKYKARKLIKLLAEEKDFNNRVILYRKEWDTLIEYNAVLSDNNDSRIIISAMEMQKHIPDLVFVTQDYCCFQIARAVGLDSVYFKQNMETDDYSGYKEIIFSDEKLSKFYESSKENDFGLLINEYLIIKDSTNQPVGLWKWTEAGFKKVKYETFESMHFGIVKPKDIYQNAAMDSLVNNQITMIGGPAGSGKTLLALGYLFSLLEKRKIDRIVIFCNPTGARDAAKLGFYKGTVMEKILSTQVGHVLSSKLGDMEEVNRLLDNNMLQIIPVVDARGYEVPPFSGVYILESQNLTSDLLRLILQRTSEDSKIIVDGDRLEQLDSAIYVADNGMKKMSKVFRNSELFGQVDLKNIYRSKIAMIADGMKD